MKLGIISVTHYSVHSVAMWKRHCYDWILQTNPNWELNLVHDGISHEPCPATNETLDFFCLKNLDSKKRVKVFETAERRQYWGHYGRQEYIQKVDTDLLYITNADNQVCPSMVDIVLKEFETNDDLGMLSFELGHHYFGYGSIGGEGTYPCVNRIDWASFVVKTEIARQASFDPTYSGGDGQYAQSCHLLCQKNELEYKHLKDRYLAFQN